MVVTVGFMVAEFTVDVVVFGVVGVKAEVVVEVTVEVIEVAVLVNVEVTGGSVAVELVDVELGELVLDVLVVNVVSVPQSWIP